MLLLLAAHVLGDFTFQTERQVKSKIYVIRFFKERNWSYFWDSVNNLTIHCLTYTAMFAPLVFLGLPIWTLVLIFLTHFVIDCNRWVIKRYEPATILTDQAFHLIVLGVISFTI